MEEVAVCVRARPCVELCLNPFLMQEATRTSRHRCRADLSEGIARRRGGNLGIVVERNRRGGGFSRSAVVLRFCETLLFPGVECGLCTCRPLYGAANLLALALFAWRDVRYMVLPSFFATPRSSRLSRPIPMRVTCGADHDWRKYLPPPPPKHTHTHIYTDRQYLSLIPILCDYCV